MGHAGGNTQFAVVDGLKTLPRTLAPGHSSSPDRIDTIFFMTEYLSNNQRAQSSNSAFFGITIRLSFVFALTIFVACRKRKPARKINLTWWW